MEQIELSMQNASDLLKNGNVTVHGCQVTLLEGQSSILLQGNVNCPYVLTKSDYVNCFVLVEQK